MGTKTYTIGDLAALSGQSVRRIRFYSDRGLLPPTGRSAANYRIYTDLDLGRLELIRALRAAGVDLASIARVLERKVTLRDVLKVRLDLLEAELTSKRRAVKVLRTALRLPDPDESDLRRLWTMTTTSDARMKAIAERFIREMTANAEINDETRQDLASRSLPRLPDRPTAEQLAAWDELADLLADDGFIAEMQKEAVAFWADAPDPAAYQSASMEAYEAARVAVSEGTPAAGPAGREIGGRWLQRSAAALGRDPDADFLAWHAAQYSGNRGRVERYRELMALLAGLTVADEQQSAWAWLHDAAAACV